jgi:hypothetical protein
MMEEEELAQNPMVEPIREKMAELMGQGEFERVILIGHQISKKCEELQGVLALYSRIAHQALELSRPLPKSEGSTEEPKPEKTATMTMQDLVEEILKEAKRPLTLREVYERLKEIGRAPSGKNPLNSVYTYLSRLASAERISKTGTKPVRYELMKQRVDAGEA